MSSSTIIIPARYAATRFPAKLLQDLCGKSVLQRTWEAANAAGADLVAIATDHQEIARLAQDFGAQVVFTSDTVQNGSDRVCEAALTLNLADDDLVINLQGDEPLFSSSDINLLLVRMRENQDMEMASMMHPMEDRYQFDTPGCVKVVTDAQGRALYFSRAGIPYPRNHIAHTPMMHQGIYGFRLRTLKRFVSMPPCVLEQLESLEQLRALYHGIAIHMVVSQDPAHPGVDTPEDLEYARKVLSQS